MRIAILAASAAITVLAAACGDDDAADTTLAPATTTPATSMTETSTSQMTSGSAAGTGAIPEVAAEAGRFSTLVAAIEAAGLGETLAGPGPFTVFAPTDDAFAALPEGALDALLADPAALAEILSYHVVSGEVLAADVIALPEAETVQGASITITIDGDAVVLNGGARVLQTDVPASNGVIHVIDTVLVPPAA